MLKKLSLIVILLATNYVIAQTYYWVGGSGNLNDGAHWSLKSGGAPANISPSNNTNLVFDDNASKIDLAIDITGLNHVKSIKFINKINNYRLIGSNLSVLYCREDFILSEKTFFEANTKIIFEDVNSIYHTVNFSKNTIDADVLFEDGNWDLQSVKITDNKVLKINKGNYKVNDASIIAGNFEVATAHKVVFFSTSSVFYIKNRIIIGDQVTFNATDLVLIAQKNNPLLYKIDSNVNFGTNSKVVGINPTPQTCAISYSFTSPSCNGSCDASITVNFDAGCTTGPYDILFNNSSGCFPSGANGVLPPTFSLNSLCSCVGQLDVFVFDVNGLVANLSNLSTPQDPTPVNMIFSGLKQPKCFGNCDGSVNIFTTGGAPPYQVTILSSPSGATVSTYSNVPALSTTTVSGLCAGTFSFIVADNNNCIKSFTTTMTQPTAVNPNVTTTQITCNSVCNGSATATPSGGTAGYTYSWISASSTPSTSTASSIGNLCPGVVTMTVTDSKTCTATFSTTISQPPAITLTVTKTNLICGALCDGTASVTATGGLGAFTYSWSPTGGNTALASNLCAGIYTCTVSNNGNCIKTVTVEITSPPTLTATPTQTNVICNGVCSGAINLNPSGGTGAFSYLWSPIAVPSGSLISNLCAGPYSYTVTDAALCKYTNSLTVIQPPATTLTVTKTDVNCNGSCNGTASAIMLGGLAPYSYTWSPTVPAILGQGTPNASGLCPNTYSLTAQDANGCAKTQTFIITQPLTITLGVTSASLSCNAVCSGSINSTPTGGQGPYTFTLQSSSTTLTSNPPYTNLCAGSYTLTVKDALGCSKTQTINLAQPNPITLALNTTSISCFNQCNATISTVVNGGTPGYTFVWSPAGSTGSSLINQCAGVQSSTVTDAQGCKASATVTVASVADLSISIVPTNPNCNGQCTGILTTSVSGGTPNYTISLNNGSTGNIISNLCQGNYTTTVTDFNGCIKTKTIEIIAPPALTLTKTNGATTCAGSCNGSVSVIANGGTASYFYNWNSTPTQTTAAANNLCAGNYVVVVTDALGCIANIAASVTQPTVLTVSIGNVQPSCNVCIGEATATGAGGTLPYTYSWLPGGQNSATANNLCIGVQTLTLQDNAGCVTTQTVQINQTVISLITTSGSTLSCNGDCNAIAAVNPSGGTGAYSYTWTPPPAGSPIQNTQTATGLCSGTHTVMVTDAVGCSSTNTVTFVNPPALSLTVNKTDINCNGVCNGNASAVAGGGTGALSYLWLPGGQTTATVSGLCAGDYTVKVTDINNCFKTEVITIIQNDLITATFTASNPVTCTSTDGSISAVISGGLPGYTFTWSPGNSNANPLQNISSGVYSLSISDAAGCTQTIVATLNNPTGPTVTVVSNSITCFGNCTGAATLNISGSPPFNVDGNLIVGNIFTLSGLCSGITTPVITDGNSCVTNQTVNIIEPLQLASTGVVTNDACNASCTASINLSPSGGTLPYSFIWSPAGAGEDPINLCADNYTVDITDGNGCATANSFTITQPAALALTFNKKDILCNGQCSGGVKAVVAGGTTPYTYTWTAAAPFVTSNIDTLVNLCSGIYSVSVKDFNGCVITNTIDITEPTLLTSSVTANNIVCNGQCNGSAVINASGGAIPYAFSYNTTPAAATQTITNLCVGAYVGTVTDANGCAVSNNFDIEEPLPIVVTTTVSQPLCNGVCNGSVTTSVTGGNSNYTYNWIPSGGNASNAIGLCADNYSVIVTDDNLCNGQALVLLVEPALLIANTTFTNPLCNAACNGIVSADPIGGTAPFSYSWQLPTINTNTIVSNLCAGDYTLTLTDANLCQDVQVVTLVDPISITLNPAATPATCGFNDGSIDAVTSEGTAPYTYNWLNPILVGQSTNSVVTAIPAGTYTVIVTDFGGCTTTSVIPLSNSNGPSGVTITSTMVACNGQCNGAADISNPLGGTAPYTLSWINPNSTATLISNLCPGNYLAQIADFNNCLLFQPLTITEPQVIDDNEVIVSANCAGNCNGSIALNPIGGNAGAYTFLWSSAATTGTITNLCPGVYTATITDVLGCSFNADYNLPSITTITSSTFAINNNCFGDCSGSLLATNVAGGLPPYSFAWSDGQPTVQAISLCNGDYSVTITDANGCFNNVPANILSPAEITFTPTVTQPACGACDGSAIINPVGGTPNYLYVWSNGQVNNTISNLCAGVYDVQITDQNGCITNSNVIIDNSSTITGENISIQDVSCLSTCDGSVTVTAIGGTGTISYNWIHNGSNSQTLNGVCAGTYFCNMIDANGCIRTASVEVGSTTNFTITPQITQSSCTVNTGSINVNVVGGTNSYTYAWTPAAASTPSLTNLAPGNYTLSVSDGNCVQTEVYSINTLNAPIINTTITDISCDAVCDGSIEITITGGTPTYSIAWSTGATTSTVSALCAGVYSLSVVDAAGCVAVENYSLTTISPVVFSFPNINNPLCNNDCNGEITTIPSGGLLPYTYSWAVSTSTTSFADDLCSGNYSVFVSDANGCVAQETFTLANPPLLTFTPTITNATCNTALDGAITTTVAGGSSPYIYSWLPGPVSTPSLTNVIAGTYTLTLTDVFGCTIDSVLQINSTIIVDAITGNDTVLCENNTVLLNGTNSIGGTGNTYEWFLNPLIAVISNSITTTVVPAVGTNTYVLVVTNGPCVDRDTMFVTSNALPIVDAGVTISIPMFATATIGGNPTSATATTYSWSPVLGLDNASSANPTSATTVTTIYTVAVTDANGCSNSDSITVNIYPQIIIPNGFSPNGDGKNDTWIIDYILQFPDIEVEVYNRWGEQLFYSKGYSVPFNGQYNGKDLPVGTYYYVIKLNHPEYPEPYTSPLTIFR
jgi:gliding motility-associated-like protein